MDRLSAPEQNRLLAGLSNLLRKMEQDSGPEFLPKGLDVMGLVRQLALPSAETVEKLSYGDPLFRMPQQSNIPITTDRGYVAEVLGMAPAVPAASRATTRISNEMADQLVRAITGNPQATAPGALEAAGQMAPISRIIRENPTPFTVAHGTTEPFSRFESGMGRTAKDIYTVPEELSEDASLYGSVLIKATASPKKMIDFSDYDKLDQQTISAIKKAAEDSGVTDEYYTFDAFLDDLMSGQLYQSGGGPRAQNNFLAELFSEYDAVKMPDARVGGGLSQSLVVQNPDVLKVTEVNGEPVEKVFPGILDKPAFAGLLEPEAAQEIVKKSTKRSDVQAEAKSLGLPATGKTAEIQELIDIIKSDPSSWSREQYNLIRPYLAIHQDVRPGSAERAETIMREGLRSGMVDYLEPMERGEYSFARGLLGTDAYIFPTGGLRFKSPSDPYLAPGNVPLFRITPEKGQDIYEAIVTTAKRNE